MKVITVLFSLCLVITAQAKPKPVPIVNVRDFAVNADGKSHDSTKAARPYINRASLVASVDNIELYGPGTTTAVL